MKQVREATQETLQALLSGSHPLSKKYGGKQVLVIDNKILPLARGKKALTDFKKLKEKYGKSPIVTFVPQPGASYILILR